MLEQFRVAMKKMELRNTLATFTDAEKAMLTSYGMINDMLRLKRIALDALEFCSEGNSREGKILRRQIELLALVGDYLGKASAR